MANTNQTAEEQEAIKRKRVFKKFQFRGVDLDKLVRTGSGRTRGRAGVRASQACAEAAQRVGARARAYAYARAQERERPRLTPAGRADGRASGQPSKQGHSRTRAALCRAHVLPASCFRPPYTSMCGPTYI